MPSRTLFGVHIYLTGVGIQTLLFYIGGFRRPKRRTADEDTPLFVCGSTAITNHSGIWVSVGNMIVVG